MKLLFNTCEICVGMKSIKYFFSNKIKPSFPISDIELDIPIGFNPIGHAKKHLIGEFKENETVC
jgi:hypothetical protein